jgi:3-hydroxy-9,10-secoandrosta-1,3,5(10)-triene-9,17-dione monooxygenase reductase component
MDLVSAVDPAAYRHALGHFCSGVTVVTSVDGAGAPVGFACQAFAALSLQPPLVLFCPSGTSGTWPHIERNGRFCVNVLAEDQRRLSRAFGRSGPDKFAGVAWSPGPNAAPVLDGVLAWAACEVQDVATAGDHLIVVGLVTDLGPSRDGRPLLFYRGRYTSTEAEPFAEPPEVIDTLLAWPRHTDWM